jgi:hypothetical protein
MEREVYCWQLEKEAAIEEIMNETLISVPSFTHLWQ